MQLAAKLHHMHKTPVAVNVLTVPLVAHDAVNVLTVPLVAHDAVNVLNVPLVAHDAVNELTVPLVAHDAVNVLNVHKALGNNHALFPYRDIQAVTVS